MSQYIIVKVNTDEEMNLRYEQDFENYDGLYVPVSDKPRYEKVGELIMCENCKYYNSKIGFCWAKDEYYLPSDYCSDGE